MTDAQWIELRCKMVGDLRWFKAQALAPRRKRDRARRRAPIRAKLAQMRGVSC